MASGLFLVLLQPDTPDGHHEPIRAIVRHTRLSQLGHWMMGTIRVRGKSLGVSGAYGNDGLTMSVERSIYDRAVLLPEELHHQWNTGGGHNSAGSEAGAMRAWARENLGQLRA